MKTGKYIVNKPIDLHKLIMDASLIKYYWHKDFENVVHFTANENKILNTWVGWGCSIYCIAYVVRNLGFVFNLESILKIAESNYDIRSNGLTPYQIIDVLNEISKSKLARVRARIKYVSNLDQIKSILKDTDKRIIVNYWDVDSTDKLPRKSDPEAGLKWDWGHYGPLIEVKDDDVIIAGSSYRYSRYGYGIAGIPYKVFKKNHCDFIHAENSISQDGIARSGLTWLVGLIIVIESVN